MKVLATNEEVRAWCGSVRARGESVSLVPTQGCLHEGHAALIEHARTPGGSVAATVFVNPMQFRSEGYRSYPRTPERDITAANDAGADALFMPDLGEVYPGVRDADQLLALAHEDHGPPGTDSFSRSVPIGDGTVRLIRVPSRLSMRLDGRDHPWHFDGVATVVARLLEIFDPDRACFGEKDIQQLAVLRAMNDWLGGRARIVPVPIVRGADGVSMSSRLGTLDEDGRAAAAAIARVMLDASERVGEGESDLGWIEGSIRERARSVGATIDSVEVVDPRTLEPIERFGGVGVVYAAFFVGGVRLQECVSLGEG